MKKKILTSALALVCAAVMIIGSMAALATPAAAEESHTPKPIPLKFTKEGAPDGYDGITVGKVYEHAYYTIDMDFLLDGFSAEDFFKNYTTQCDLKLRFIDDDAIWLHSDAKASYSLIDGYWSKEYPYITYWFEDTPKEESFWHCYYDIMHFTGPFTVPQVTVKFNLHDETPRFEYSLALYIEDHKTGLTVFSKRIRINLCDDSYKISELEIHDFDFQQKHGSLLKRDTADVWCDVGNVASIRYLEEDKKTEYTETAARAGMKGWIEFTISKGQNGCSFASEVQAKLFAGGYTGESVDVTTASDGSLCKAYFYFSIPDDDTYVIKQGTIGFTIPKAGAAANSKVTPSNIKTITRRVNGNPVSYPQFTVGSAVWLTIDNRGTTKSVSSFTAGNTYHALVKLTPYSNYYFNADSIKNIVVPGAERFSITYHRAGDNKFITEDGWYLRATFPMVATTTFDLEIGYDKPNMTVTQNDKAYLTATSSCDLSKATDVSVQWYWSKDITTDTIGEICSASDGDLKLQLDTSTVGTSYYKCVISCTLNGKSAKISYPGSEWVKVTINAKPKEPFKISPVGSQNVVVNSPDDDFAFEVSTKNAAGNVQFVWQACDKNGKVTNASVLGNGQALLINGLPESENGKTKYYKCTATSGSETSSVVFSAKLEITYFDLTITYSKTDVTLEQGSKAEITAQTNVDPMLASNLNVVWYEADDANGKNEKVLSGANTPKITLPTDKVGTKYYRCVVSCVVDGEYSKLVYTASKWVKVTVNAKGEVPTTSNKPESSNKPETSTNKPETSNKPGISTTNPETSNNDPATSTNVPDTTTPDQPSVTTKTPTTADPDNKPSDPSTKDDPTEEKESSFPIWIVIVAVAVLLAAGAVVVVIVIKKKNNINSITTRGNDE